MSISTKTSIVGGIFAFIVATSCCWLPALIIGIGGASSMLAFSETLEQYSGIFIAIGVLMMGYGLYFYKQSTSQINTVVLYSTIICPKCHTQKLEQMPTDACQFFYECTQCKEVIRPLTGDCCVYCSYGDVACPPMQQGAECC